MASRLAAAALFISMAFSIGLAQRQTRIAEPAFTVPPGHFAYYPFFIPGRVENPGVVGRFRASGGSRNDIRVMIMDSDSFENYRNGNQFRVFYDSGFATVGSLNHALAPGNYVLVFDNRPSVVSNKAVRADIFAQWW